MPGLLLPWSLAPSFPSYHNFHNFLGMLWSSSIQVILPCAIQAQGVESLSDIFLPWHWHTLTHTLSVGVSTIYHNHQPFSLLPSAFHFPLSSVSADHSSNPQTKLLHTTKTLQIPTLERPTLPAVREGKIKCLYGRSLKTCKNDVVKLRGRSMRKEEGVIRLFTNHDL